MRFAKALQRWVLLNALILLPGVACDRIGPNPDSEEARLPSGGRRVVTFREDVYHHEEPEEDERRTARPGPQARSLLRTTTTGVNRDFYFPGPTQPRQRSAAATAPIAPDANPDFYFDYARDDRARKPGGRDRPLSNAPAGAAAGGGAGFSYQEKDKNGPSSWYRIAPACGGKFQSPIMLNTSSALYVRNKRPLQLVGQTNLPQTIRLQNDGHSAKFTYAWAEGERPYIRGGPLKTKYYFEQFHFHWGADDSMGSEHVLDYHRFPMEVHLVFWNALYSSFEDARGEVDGLAVVGLFYEMYDRFNEQLNSWTRYLREIAHPGSEYTIQFIDTFPLYELVGDFEWPYFSYEGSLTTPPCLETVTWIVSAKPLLITAKEMREFRKLRAKAGPLVNNYRPLQKLHNRRVYRY